MWRGSAYVVAIAVLTGAHVHADDASEVVALCRNIVVASSRDAQLAIERRAGTWRLVGFGANVEHWNRFEPRIRACDAVEMLTINGDQGLSPEGWRQLARLHHLRYVGTSLPLTAAHLEAISSLPQLTELNLRACDKEALDSQGIRHLRGVLRLVLDGRGLTDSSMKQISSLTQIENLDLRRNDSISDAGLSRLTGLSELRHLSLGGVTSVTDAGIGQLRPLTKLESLSVYRIGPAGLAVLSSLPKLGELTVSVYSRDSRAGCLSRLQTLDSLKLGQIRSEAETREDLPPKLRRLSVPFLAPRFLALETGQRLECVEVSLGRSLMGDDKRNRDLEWLGRLPALREVTLVSSIQSDVLAVAGLTPVRTLAVRGNPCLPAIGNDGLRALAQLRGLESLTIEDYYDGGLDEAAVRGGMDVLPKLSRLRRVALHGLPAVTSKDMEHLWQLGSLSVLELDLVGAHLDADLDGMVARVATLADLEELSLSFRVRVKLTDDGLRQLAGLRKLRRLDLASDSGNIYGYTDEGLAALMRALPRLEVLRVHMGAQLAEKP